MFISRRCQGLLAAMFVCGLVGSAADAAIVSAVSRQDPAPPVPAGHLSGRVTADDGKPVAGVVVSVGALPTTSDDQTKQVTTDANGNYAFDQLTPGPWSLAFSGQQVEVGGRVDLAADRGMQVSLVVNKLDGRLLRTIAPTDPQAASRPQPQPVGPLLPVPVKVRDHQAIYPTIARQARMQGIVEFALLILRDGSVQATILKSIPMLDAAALDAVRQWRFAPTLINGVPTSVTAPATVTFSLTRGYGVGDLLPPTVSPASAPRGSR